MPMNLEVNIQRLYEKDTSAIYQLLLELEALSETQNLLYPFFTEFCEMCKSKQYVVRVRGFRLACKQARWDTDEKLEASLPELLHILEDEKPTAVRQALKALEEVARYKPELGKLIADRALAIDCLRYKETMHSLLQKDVRSLLEVIQQADTI